MVSQSRILVLNNMRKRIYEITEVAENNDVISQVYDVFMIVVIVASIVPLAFKDSGAWGTVVDIVCVVIFIIDYILRWMTADYRYPNQRKVTAFLRYPVSFMALIDLISILPSFVSISAGFRLVRVFRLFRAFRVFRVFKGLRYSKNFKRITAVMRKSKDSLIAVGVLAVGYILIAALIVFNVEPESFGNFFDAIYWATVSLTTVGYGDIYPVTVLGRIVTMVSAILGIAVVALPAGIITAGYMKQLEEEKKDL